GRKAARPDTSNGRGLVRRSHPRPGQVSKDRRGGETMIVLGLALLVVAADADDGLAQKMLPIYVKEASEYSIAVEPGSKAKKELELMKEPVFEWSNPTRQGLQQGAVFLWMSDGRPSAVGCIFSQPHDKPAGRQIIHEMHALDPDKLIVTRTQ